MAKTVGSAIVWTENDLDALSVVSHLDMDNARAYWRAHCRPADRTLLDTGSDDERRCLRALDAVLLKAEGETAALVAQLAAGAIDVAGWQLGMANVVKMTTVCAVAAARGAWNRVTLEDLR
jgi:hypothetical protein